MAEHSWNDLIEQAQAEGFTSKTVAPGTYTATAEQTNHGTTQGGAPQVGIMWRITSPGEFQNVTLWDNINLNTANPKAVAMFFKKWAALGVSAEDFATIPPGAAGMPHLADRIKGQSAEIKVTHEQKKTGDGVWVNVFPQKLVAASAVTVPVGAVRGGTASAVPPVNPFMADV